MRTCRQQATLLKDEAGHLLQELDIVEMLEKYGPVHLTGSYTYDLMTLADIDVCVEIAIPGLEILFSMGKDIATLPGVGSMYFRNEFVL